MYTMFLLDIFFMLFRNLLRFQFSAVANKQKFLVLFGAPGVGKGTYAKFLKKDLGYNHISTGD